MTNEKNKWFGLHERLNTPALERQLAELGLSDLAKWQRPDNSEELPAIIKTHLAQALASAMLVLKDTDEAAWQTTLSAFRNALVGIDTPLHAIADQIPNFPFRKLIEISKPDSVVIRKTETKRPDIPLSISSLLTGSQNSPSLISQIEKELASADQTEWLVSFIKFSGVRALMPALRQFVETPRQDGEPRLRIATTSYLGATDLKAIETLLELPNTEVRVSFDTHRTRLHAKAYLFHRNTGFGSAYVGSANVSRVALDEGLEWTAKISQHELPHFWHQVAVSFQMHWADTTEFEPITKDNLDRLGRALESERCGPKENDSRFFHFVDVKPHTFQQEILDAIAYERAAGIKQHLVIAATGTGKTMLAAFDYQRFARREDNGSRPSLLFIAHREEILRQALASFRNVLRDSDFGDLLVGGHDPSQSRYLFCSVQSWNSRGLSRLSPSHFDYVVMDEAHHAAASSYQNILKHVQPESLLGLTATPERTDGSDIRSDFGGAFTHELRLADAIEAYHLSPFHYFGIRDESGVDFSGLSWQRGGYSVEDLNKVIGTNELRARWVLRNLGDHVADVRRVRALGFCVSKKHAHYMADFFSAHGLPAVALTSDSTPDVRSNAQRQLVNREIMAIFTVDLFNEGIDIPEVDTVMLLRPTESLTVYLQQLGRGLRKHDGKSHLTVLDFIAPQNRQFRFADRFRALSTKPALRVDRQVRAGFPWLPAGCLVQLDEQATEVVLSNIRSTLAQKRPKVVQQLAQLRATLDSEPSLVTMLDWLHFEDADLLVKTGLPCRLLEEAGGPPVQQLGNLESSLQKGARNILIADDRDMLSVFLAALQGRMPEDTQSHHNLSLALAMVWGSNRPRNGEPAALAYFSDNPELCKDFTELIQYRLTELVPVMSRRFPHVSQTLALHAHYSREQILLSLGKGSFQIPFPHQSGVQHIPSRKVDAFFVTINKSEKDFSPSTLYEDYALNEDLFHWQTQSTTTPESQTGQRYINHVSEGYQPLLFVRESKKLSNGLTAPFQYLGPIEYVRHEGSRPMSIVWRLLNKLPAKSLRQYRRIAL